MRAYLSICNLGPISQCKLELDDFTVLTGRQASGKSTIAKCIFFCRTIKDDILTEILRYKMSFTLENDAPQKLFKKVKKSIREKFLQIFGTSLAMSSDMSIHYKYSAETWIKVSLRRTEGLKYINTKFVIIDFSDDINTFLHQFDKEPVDRTELQKKLNYLFHDDYDTIFIPAGRSLISLFTLQLNYIFATMDDEQKKSLDYCTQKYIEYILKIRPFFSNGIRGLVFNYKNQTSNIQAAQNIMDNVLHGTYVYENGEERLYFTNNQGLNRYVRMNYTSSGQQESVWIFNILLYLLTNKSKAFIIVEEPEAHLYPDAQKSISEMLALMLNSNCQILITTHSPYILGALNNLIYASHLCTNHNIAEKVKKLVNKNQQISNYNAYFVDGGEIVSCLENGSEKLIINEFIDGASKDINQLYDDLFDISLSIDGE